MRHINDLLGRQQSFMQRRISDVLHADVFVDGRSLADILVSERLARLSTVENAAEIAPAANSPTTNEFTPPNWAVYTTIASFAKTLISGLDERSLPNVEYAGAVQ